MINNNYTRKLLIFSACSLLAISVDLYAADYDNPNFSDNGEGYEADNIVDREDKAGKFGPGYKDIEDGQVIDREDRAGKFRPGYKDMEGGKVIDREDRAGKFGPRYKDQFDGERRNGSNISSDNGDNTLIDREDRAGKFGPEYKKGKTKSERAQSKRKRRYAARHGYKKNHLMPPQKSSSWHNAARNSHHGSSNRMRDGESSLNGR